MGVILCFSFLLLVLGGIYYPLFQIRIIGVKKLVGYANSDIFRIFSSSMRYYYSGFTNF